MVQPSALCTVSHLVMGRLSVHRLAASSAALPTPTYSPSSWASTLSTGKTTLLALRKTLPIASCPQRLPRLALLPCSPLAKSVCTTTMPTEVHLPLAPPCPAGLHLPSRAVACHHWAALSQPPLPHSHLPGLPEPAQAWQTAHVSQATLSHPPHLAFTLLLAHWHGSNQVVMVSLSLSLPHWPGRLPRPAARLHVHLRLNRLSRATTMNLEVLTPNSASFWMAPQTTRPHLPPRVVQHHLANAQHPTAHSQSATRSCIACSRTAALLTAPMSPRSRGSRLQAARDPAW